MERFCTTCGKDVEVVLVEKVDEYKGQEVWYALCPKGHQFSPTHWGRSIVLVPNGGGHGNDD